MEKTNPGQCSRKLVLSRVEGAGAQTQGKILFHGVQK